MIRFRPLPLMTLLFLAALMVLLQLGRWQWQRYEEKTALAQAPAAEMTLVNYALVEDGLQFVYAVAPGGVAGWRVFAPVRMGEEAVFVDADFIAGQDAPVLEEVRASALLRFGRPLTGAAVRPGPPGPLSAPAQLEQRLWFDIDLAAMGRRAGLGKVANYYVAISYVGPDGREAANPFARAGGADALPPARHMGYAISWWGIAIVLACVYFAYHMSVGRLTWAGRASRD